MRRFRILVMGALAASLAVGTIGAPVAAADPRLLLVNGIPGRTVDICIGNNEVRSGLKYGGTFRRLVAPGNKTLRFRAASPGRCNGTIIASYTRNFLVDEDLTIVATKQAPKIVVFTNPPLGIGPTMSGAFRYAGDLGELQVRVYLQLFTTPTAVGPTFSKGQQYYFPYSQSVIWDIMAWRLGAATPFVRGFYNAFDGYRSEFILVGSSLSNDRVIVARRPVA